jgi:hypothetical protein
LLDELGLRQVAERAVWPALIVVNAPRFDLRLCVRNRGELDAGDTSQRRRRRLKELSSCVF